MSVKPALRTYTLLSSPTWLEIQYSLFLFVIPFSFRHSRLFPVIPAKAGIHSNCHSQLDWESILFFFCLFLSSSKSFFVILKSTPTVIREIFYRGSRLISYLFKKKYFLDSASSAEWQRGAVGSDKEITEKSYCNSLACF